MQFAGHSDYCVFITILTMTSAALNGVLYRFRLLILELWEDFGTGHSMTPHQRIKLKNIILPEQVPAKQ